MATPARRCLAPVTSFSEYGVALGENGKEPLHGFEVPSRPIFALAGIWRSTERDNAYGFLTTEPNTFVAPIHPKAMPVIVHHEDYDRWLSEPWDQLGDVVCPSPSQYMVVGSGSSPDQDGSVHETDPNGRYQTSADHVRSNWDRHT